MKKVMVVFHSQEHGHTAKCATLVAEGLERSGVQVEMVNTNETNRVGMAAFASFDGVAIGSPDYASYVAGTIKQFFDDLYIARRQGLDVEGKPCVIFMTHGGGGRGMEPFRGMASRRLNLVSEPFSCQHAPPEGCPEAVALGEALAAAL